MYSIQKLVKYIDFFFFLHLYSMYSMTDKNKKEYQEIVLNLLKGTKDQSELKNIYSEISENNNELKNKEIFKKLKQLY